MRKTLLTLSLIMASYNTVAADGLENMSNFNYNYIDARIGASPHTYGAAFSHSIHPNAHITGRIDSEFDSDYDTAFGLGFHAPVTNWADITGEILLRAMDEKHASSDAGMELNFGVRQWLGPQFEVGGKVGYVSLDDDNDWIASVHARIHLTEVFSLAAEGRFNDFYDNQAVFSARFAF